jgi:hypothetical protein
MIAPKRCETVTSINQRMTSWFEPCRSSIESGMPSIFRVSFRSLMVFEPIKGNVRPRHCYEFLKAVWLREDD